MSTRLGVTTQIRIEPIYDIARNFEPKQYDISTAIYKIPEHQRESRWNQDKKVSLIQSILNGFPIPSIIVRHFIDDGQIKYYVEDGQQRLTTVWEFCNGYFSVDDMYFSNNDNQERPLLDEEDRDLIKRYQIPLTVFTGEISSNIRSKIFYLLNSGLRLSDADRLWSMKEKPMINYTIEAIQTENGRNIGDFPYRNKTRSGLRSAVGMVTGLSCGNDFITTSFERLLDKMDDEPNRQKITQGIAFISKIYNNVSESGLTLTNSQRTTLGKFLGLLVYDFNQIYLENDNDIMQENYSNYENRIVFWSEFLKIVSRNDTKFWNLIVTSDRRGANLSPTILTQRIHNITEFLNKSEAEKMEHCQAQNIIYVSE